MFTVAEMLSLPPARALLGTITQDRTGLTDRYTMKLDLPFCPIASGRSCCATRVCGPLLVHRRSGAMGITANAEQGAAESPGGRERAAADGKLTGRT